MPCLRPPRWRACAEWSADRSLTCASLARKPRMVAVLLDLLDKLRRVNLDKVLQHARAMISQGPEKRSLAGQAPVCLSATANPEGGLKP